MWNLLIFLLIELICYKYFASSVFTIVTIILLTAYFISKIRYSFAVLPFYLLNAIQGKKFKVITSQKDIKFALSLSDKGRALEDLFAIKAWEPILSVESINGETWKIVRKNLDEFMKYLPQFHKLGLIATQEANRLLSLGITITSKQISISTLKIFLRYLFCENDQALEIKTSSSPVNGDCLKPDIDKDCQFIDKYLNDDFLEKMYSAALEWRKEIAIKGPSDKAQKTWLVNSVVKILKSSKFGTLWDWSNPEYFSVVLQPFVVSPSINMSDIGFSIKKHKKEYNVMTHKEFLDYVEHCIYQNHPFPFLERYDSSTNTYYLIELANLKNVVNYNGAIFNFGYGPRKCVGRAQARIFIDSFFKALLDKECFKPEEGHLYSGRNNDENFNIGESIYQVKIILGVIYSEFRKFII